MYLNVLPTRVSPDTESKRNKYEKSNIISDRVIGITLTVTRRVWLQ